MPKEPSPKPDTQVKPDPKLEKRGRKTFPPEYKLRIIQEADTFKHGVPGFEKSAPGPVVLKSAEQRQIEKLEKQVARLKNDLGIANDCLDLQKKVLSIIDRSNSGSML